MIKQKLQQYFNFSEFRAGQEEVVESILAGNDAVVLMPTGGGKSLCFQLPAVINTSITIVISPLIALMKDQVDSLKLRGIGAAYINSSQTGAELNATLDQVRRGEVKILYIAPERLKSYSFLQMFVDLKVGFIAVDEAHCVSSWGHDFRPDYMLIKDFIAQFKERPTVAAFTATATPEVRDDIVSHLNLKNPKIFVRGFDRPNLKFIVRNDLVDDRRKDHALAIIQKTPGSGIVYSLTRKGTEAMAVFFNARGVKAVAYHAGMNSEDRTRVQDEFMENKYKVIIATIAFGMGVNKSDIRFVIHVGMPSSLENYYQEAGRAGRDGEPAECVLLAARKDFGLQSFFIGQARKEMVEHGKDPTEIKRVIDIKYRKLDKMQAYVDARVCRRKLILQYFSDADIQKYQGNCQGCDVCLKITDPAPRFEPESLRTATRLARRGGWRTAFASLDEAGDARFMEMLRRSEPNEWGDFNDADEDEFDDEAFELELARRRPVGKKKDYSHNELNLSDTILASVELYRAGHKPKDIAKLRGLGVSTIFNHLLQWYEAGGELKISDFVTPEEEKLILSAVPPWRDAPEIGYLGSIKAKLPPNVSYDQIRLALAKAQKVKV